MSVLGACLAEMKNIEYLVVRRCGIKKVKKKFILFFELNFNFFKIRWCGQHQHCDISIIPRIISKIWTLSKRWLALLFVKSVFIFTLFWKSFNFHRYRCRFCVCRAIQWRNQSRLARMWWLLCLVWNGLFQFYLLINNMNHYSLFM